MVTMKQLVGEVILYKCINYGSIKGLTNTLFIKIETVIISVGRSVETTHKYLFGFDLNFYTNCPQPTQLQITATFG